MTAAPVPDPAEPISLPPPWVRSETTPDLPPLPDPAPARLQRSNPTKLRAKTRAAARRQREDRPDR